MLSEINPLNLKVASELLRSAGPKYRPVVDDISAVSDLQGFSNVMVSDKDPDLLGFQVINYFLNLQNRDGIDARKGLVEQDELGRYHQRSGDLDPPPLTT